MSILICSTETYHIIFTKIQLQVIITSFEIANRLKNNYLGTSQKISKTIVNTLKMQRTIAK